MRAQASVDFFPELRCEYAAVLHELDRAQPVFTAQPCFQASPCIRFALFRQRNTVDPIFNQACPFFRVPDVACILPGFSEIYKAGMPVHRVEPFRVARRHAGPVDVRFRRAELNRFVGSFHLPVIPEQKSFFQHVIRNGNTALYILRAFAANRRGSICDVRTPKPFKHCRSPHQ